MPLPAPTRRLALVRRVAVAAAGLALVASAPAVGQVTFTFQGRGWGHGVGMSQYGARGYALNGWDATRILAHYYTGVTIERRPPVTLRVLLNRGVPALTVIPGTGGATVTPRPGGAPVTLAAGTEYTARYAGGGARLEGPGGAVVATSAVGLDIAPVGAALQAGRRTFRGVIDVTPRADGLWVVNRIDSELYLRGVVPREMSASWGDDAAAALQAQAVAARTYAISRMSPQRSYDVADDTSDQVYGGFAAEDRRSNAAVDATAGMVMTYQGTPINAMFSSTSGGYTEDYVNVFGGTPVPYLRGVPDPYDDISPRYRWRNPPSFTAAALGAKLGLKAPVTEFDVVERGVSPRAKTVRVTTADGAVSTFTGWRVRGLLGLDDSWFWVVRSDRPDPGEPPVAGTPAPAPATTPASRPRRAPTLLERRGRWLVVVQRTGDRRVARRLVVKLRPKRAGTRIITRPAGRKTTSLVVTGRYATRAEALREVLALRRLRHPARIAKAVASDPPVRSKRWPVVANTTAVPAPGAHGTFRVVVADVATTAQARAVVARLKGHTPRPRIVSRWTPIAGTRYVVVTVTRGTSDQARRERAALVRAGFPGATVQPSDDGT